MYVMSTDQLARYRQAVAGDPAGGSLREVIAGIERHGIEVGPGAHPPLKSAPRGYPVDHPRIDLLRYKGVVAWRQWPVAAWLGTAAARRRVVEFLRTTRPLDEWLAAHVGPATADPR